MIANIKNKFAWLFSSHYKMERFGVMFVILVLCMGLLVSSIVVRKNGLDKAALGNQVLYTTEFSMSLTGLSGNVVNVYSNTDRTKAFLLLKWANPAQMVSDANKYTMFLTGSDINGKKTVLQSAPSASIYMFGSTGYMGIYLVDANGFPPQIVDLTIRCETMVAPMLPEIPAYEDTSFSNNDQCKIYFNPGGTAGSVAEFLDEDRMGIYDICEGTMIDGKEIALREKLDKDLSDMEAALAQIQEYAYRVEKDGLVVSDPPIQIKGDKIITNEDGEKSLSTAYLLAGGYEFDWRSGSILDGYLDSVIPANYVPSEHLSMSARLASSDKLMTSNLVWMNTDGTLFESDNPQNLSRITQANQDIGLLTGAWSNYYNLKKTYQTVDMVELLKMELSLHDVMTNYTVKASDAVTLW